LQLAIKLGSMNIQKTYRFKLKLNSTQTNQIERMIGSARFVYNLALETKINAYNTHRVNLSRFDLDKQLTNLKQEIDWLYETPSQTLQDVLERLDKAYKSFFNGGGFPRWAKKGEYSSVTFKSVKIENVNRVKLPKLGSVKYFNSQEIKGKLKRATIIKENNNYFISILTEQEMTGLPHTSSDSQAKVGLDVGISFFLVDSNGVYIENPRFLKNSLRLLRIEQRSLSRKVKRSNNWYKQKRVVSKIHTKLKNQRKDFTHKISTDYVLNNNLIAIEKLNIKGMVKSNLGQSISDVGWGIFFEQLKYKAGWYGSEIISVNPAYTSQTCSKCGCVSKENRKTQAKFKCVECGFEINADENGSINILDRALSKFARQREALACA